LRRRRHIALDARDGGRYNRHAGKCQYHLNETPDLGLFGDSTFDFVYSVLVLQHMAPEYAKAYLRELIRVLVPGGLLVFQMLSHRSAVEPPRSAPRTTSTGPLPESAFKAELSVAGVPVSAQAGTTLELTVTVRNASEHAWPCLAGPDLTYQVNLGARWLWKDATTHLADHAGRCPLPFDLGPSDEAELLLSLPVPRKRGKYIVELDMVQERVAWFVARGSAVLRAPCTVTAGRTDAARRVLGQAFRTLTNAARSERNISAPSDAAMEMHFILRAEILEFLDQAGARILDVQHALLPGGLQSYHYWVTR
jgi:SAM-dependent methyltransferase